VFEVDNKIRRAHERVVLDNEIAHRYTPEEQAVLDKYTQHQMEQSLKAEQLGEAGDVDGAQDAVAKAEALKVAKEAMEKRLLPDKIMSVCPVSGVFQSSMDNENRKVSQMPFPTLAPCTLNPKP
jgi:hypothetical protein